MVPQIPLCSTITVDLVLCGGASLFWWRPEAEDLQGDAERGLKGVPPVLHISGLGGSDWSICHGTAITAADEIEARLGSAESPPIIEPFRIMSLTGFSTKSATRRCWTGQQKNQQIQKADVSMGNTVTRRCCPCRKSGRNMGHRRRCPVERTTWRRWPAWAATVTVLLISGSTWLVLTQAGWADMFGTAPAGTSSAASAASAASEQEVLAEIAMVMSFLAVVTAWVVYRNRDIPAAEFAPRLFDGRRRVVGGWLGGAVVYMAVIVLAILAQQLFASTTHLQGIPAPTERSVPGGVYLLSDGLQSVAAGLWEEICLFAVPIALLAIRRIGVTDQREHLGQSCWAWGPTRWGLILATVIVLRAGIHLYYSWTMLFVIPWMVGAVLLYRALGSIWPLVIGHAAYDILVNLHDRIPQVSGMIEAIVWVILAVGIVFVAMSIVRWRLVASRAPSGNDRLGPAIETVGE